MRILPSQIFPTVVASSLNSSAYGSSVAEKQTIKSVFDRPTPYIQRSPRYLKATPSKLVATVYIPKGKAESTLLAEVEGGGRQAKKFEILMRYMGILHGDMFVVPGKGAKLDQYGNISRDQMTEIFNMLKGAKNAYFVSTRSGKTAHLARGVWLRTSRRGIVPAMLFVSIVTYKAKFPFSQTALKFIVDNFGTIFNSKLDEKLLKK